MSRRRLTNIVPDDPSVTINVSDGVSYTSAENRRNSITNRNVRAQVSRHAVNSEHRPTATEARMTTRTKSWYRSWWHTAWPKPTTEYNREPSVPGLKQPMRYSFDGPVKYKSVDIPVSMLCPWEIEYLLLEHRKYMLRNRL